MDRYLIQYLQQEEIQKRILEEAQWIIDTKCSIRQCAKEFLVSKSQVHRDLHELKHINDDLYVQVKNILRKHMR